MCMDFCVSVFNYTALGCYSILIYFFGLKFDLEIELGIKNVIVSPVLL